MLRLSAIAADRTVDLAPTRHARLRAATAEAHARLHRHPGFTAIQDATISLAGYRLLLARLLGFYLPFEAATGIGAERSGWLTADLRALGAAPAGFACCQAFTPFQGEAARLGAAYLAEGSLLGGRALARGLDVLLGPDSVDGRRFFLGRGSATGAGWQAFLARLAHGAESGAEGGAEGGHAAAVAAAVQAFGQFETWMEGWNAEETG